VLRVVCYSFLCQLLKALLLSWSIRGMTILYVLVFVLASHICTSGYLLRYLPNKTSLLVLLLLSLGVLLLYFLPLLGLFKTLRLLPLIVLTMLQLRFLLPALPSTPLTPIYLFSISLANVVLQ
jgi:hypothetical protein